MRALEPHAARLLELAIEGQPRPAITLGLDLLADGLPIEQIITDVLAPVQRQVGVLWATNRWRVADEHAATAVVDGLLGALSLETPRPDPVRGDVIVACAEGEHHTVPARMGVEILRAHGWEVTFLGGSLPADDLQRFAAQRELDAVVVSCTVPLFLPGARRCLTAIGEVGLPALAVGNAFGNSPDRALRLGASGWLGSDVDLATALDAGVEWETRPTPPEALAMERDREFLQAACLSLMAERMPVMATYTPVQLSHTRTDVGYILGFLTTAVDLDDRGIFETFVAWLSGILSTRGVPPSVLDRSLQCVVEVLEARGMTQAAAMCSAAPGAHRREWR